MDQPINIQTPSAPLPERKIGKFKASFLIALQGWNLIKKDKEVLLFPVCSALATLGVLAACTVIFFFLYVGIENTGVFEERLKEAPAGAQYLFLFIMYIAGSLVATFFQAGIVSIVHGRLNGQDLSFSDGIQNALANIGTIFLWSLLSATVGVILNVLAERLKLLGKIVVWVMGAAWGVLTFFIIPVFIIEKKSILQSLKTSAFIIRKSWGESIIVNVGAGMVFSLLGFLGILIFIASLFTGSIAVIISMGILLIIFLVVLSVISSALSTVFRVVLYEYATTGRVAEGFNSDLLQNALLKK